jgi:fructokinase
MLCVIGEALIDLVAESAPDDVGAAVPRYRAHPGGSPFNVAIGLARLGQPTLLQARLSGDAFGRQLYRYAEDNQVDLSIAVAAAEPSTLAIVGLDEHRNATYDFYLNGTSDWQWTETELQRAPQDSGWVHFGSLASWTEPAATVIAGHLSRIRAKATTVISYDPNIRPLLMGRHSDAMAIVERSVALAHVVKASAEDLAWLYPGRTIASVQQAWQQLGPSLVVVTNGGSGASAFTASGEWLSVPAQPVDVVDTVGAGDAFMAGLINALIRADIKLIGDDRTQDHADRVRRVLDEAILVAALTCARAGADPPSAAELNAAQAGIQAELGTRPQTGTR